jgi:hypothetical protein
MYKNTREAVSLKADRNEDRTKLPIVLASLRKTATKTAPSFLLS